MTGYRRVKNVVATETGEMHVITGEEGLKVPSGDVKLTVGEVGRLTSVKTSTLRHYDDIGLLCPGRTGEGISNNRKLYDADDLGRLQAILTLLEYDFSLEEIRRLLDGEVDLHEALANKLDELRRRANHLHDLILFTDFVDITDGPDDASDLIEGLACGPANLDELANLARESRAYEATIAALQRLTDEELATSLEALDDIVESIFARDDPYHFAEIDRARDRFVHWWNISVVPMEDIGYLGFWAIFEDHSSIAEHIEITGRAGDAGSIQMYVFFGWLVRLVKESGALIAEIARLADADVVAALEEAHELIDEIAVSAVGRAVADSIALEDLADLAFWVLVWIKATLGNEELRAYLGLDRPLAFDENELERTIQVVDLLGSEG